MSFEMNEKIARLIRLQRTFMKHFGINEVKEEYYNVCTRDVALITPFFPKETKTILDIGAGIGGISLLIQRQFKDIRVDLFDKNEISHVPRKIWYGFKEIPSVYNTKQDTQDFFALN